MNMKTFVVFILTLAACLGLHAQTQLNALNVTISIAGPGTNITQMETGGTASSNSFFVVANAVNAAAGWVTSSVTNALSTLFNNFTTGTNVANSGNLQSGGTNGTVGMVPVFTGVGGAWTAQTPAGGSAPTFSSQFNYNGGSGTNIIGSSLTNLQYTNLAGPQMINTFTNNVTNVLIGPGLLIKTNSLYNLYLVANNVTNIITGDNVWIDVTMSGTNFWTRY